MRLSGVVITHNEEKNIERCLKSLSFCDEIIVVDSESSDQTRTIAARFTPHVFVIPWRGYAAQKNEAVRLAQGEWILSIDADEQVSTSLREEILARLAGSPKESAFSLPRQTIHFGRWIRHGGWYPNRLIRLFRKDGGEWVGSEVHERWETSGEVGSLNSDLVHYSFENLSDQVSRNNKYSTLAALRLRREGGSFSTLRLCLKSFGKFLETYFLKKGFLDGYPGFIISVSAAYAVFLKWAKLWELENGTKEI